MSILILLLSFFYPFIGIPYALLGYNIFIVIWGWICVFLFMELSISKVGDILFHPATLTILDIIAIVIFWQKNNIILALIGAVAIGATWGFKDL